MAFKWRAAWEKRKGDGCRVCAKGGGGERGGGVHPHPLSLSSIPSLDGKWKRGYTDAGVT